MVNFNARVARIAAPLCFLAAAFTAPGCGGDEFCAKGSYECTTGGNSGTGGSASGSSGSGGSSAEAGSTASGGSAAGGSGTGGGAGTGTGGFAGMAEGGSSGIGESGSGGGDSGSTGTGGTSSTPVPCSLDAFTEGCTLASDAGIFVSPAGDDEATGASDAPLATVSAAIEKARSGSRVRPIFICTGTYRDHPEVHNDGYSLHGGFACPDDTADTWVYDSAERAKIAPNTQGYALRVRDLQGLTVTDLELIAPDASEPGESSIAVFVSNSVDVRFERVRIEARDGADGADGVLVPFEYPQESRLRGADGTDLIGGPSTACPCTGTAGGAGGYGVQGGAAGEPIAFGGGAGGTIASCAGQRGADAPESALGAGASEFGTLNASGWLPQAGKEGATGLPGQGGGGGAGAAASGGGAGACGGCGGKAGSFGGGGGASIGLLAFSSRIQLSSAEVELGNAGQGGDATNGQPGQDGGQRGDGHGLACDGGNGGNGAQGGASGGGAGGLSVGILWSGTNEPNVSDDTTIAPGTEGLGGVGGVPFENDGISGVSAALRRITD